MTSNSCKMKRCLVNLFIFQLLLMGSVSQYWSSELDEYYDVHLKFREHFFECSRGVLILPSTKICDGTSDCPDQEDEDSHPCAPKDYLLQTLTMTASDTRNTSTLLEWSTGEKSETMRGSSLTFSGYLLTANSTHKTIETRLEPKLTSYLLSGLMPWTGYNITLRRLYNSVDVWRKVRGTKLGRATTVTIKTEPSNPPAPKDVRVLADQEGKVVVCT
uniref:Secreted protein n=1 Tax=Ixodes ricinus TaxID=34613 RepID=A0A0K8R7T3_IXORI